MLAEVQPLDVFVLHNSACESSGIAFGDGFWQDERTGCDVEVFFLFSIHPFNDAFNDERTEVHLSVVQACQMALSQTRSSVVQNEDRTQDASLVGVDEYVLVALVVADRNLGRNRSTATGRLEVVNKTGTFLVDTVDITVDVNAVAVGPVIGLVHIKFVKTLVDFTLVNVFGNVDHLGGVLHKSTVLSFGSFVGAQSAPLGGVKVTSFKVRLASNQR